ncbi:MAG: nitroreductase [Micavibrio aeruginosavorus]|uniref:Putative NAD(P)H nitroreductase n=1 Tax=Micavibrio aeruginosavorus TaxID=349221 RepID=A0A2W5N2Y2_9BACT|nr:MAG: nitroreductase [Micavibrio aeruginosavorus]
MNMIDFLKSRRSTSLKFLSEPGPSPEQVKEILAVASRVPDHNKLAPWWFATFEGKGREEFGKVLRKAYLREDKDAAEAKLDLEAEKFLRAPLVIAVISRIKEGKAPQWEQMLSAGAACYNLCVAANAMGFASNWLTEWPAFNEDVRAALGCDERDNIAGFIYIGTQTEKPDERERPELKDIVTTWSEGYAPNKGDAYGKAQFGIPKAGFKTPT